MNLENLKFVSTIPFKGDSKKYALSPKISLKIGILEHTIGQLLFNDSISGNPKPS